MPGETSAHGFILSLDAERLNTLTDAHDASNVLENGVDAQKQPPEKNGRWLAL